MTRTFLRAVRTGLVLPILLGSSITFAESAKGAAACQPQQGQITATVARTGQLGAIISNLAPINDLNQESLFNCPQSSTLEHPKG